MFALKFFLIINNPKMRSMTYFFQLISKFFFNIIFYVIFLSVEAISGGQLQGDILFQVSQVGVQYTNQVGNGLSVAISGGSSLLVVISGFVAFGSSVVSLLGLGSKSLFVVVSGVGGVVDSVGEGSDFSV